MGRPGGPPAPGARIDASSWIGTASQGGRGRLASICAARCAQERGPSLGGLNGGLQEGTDPQISGGGEGGCPARMRGNGTRAAERRGGGREVRPQTSAGDSSSHPQRGQVAAFHEPLGGGGSRRGEGRVESRTQQRGGEGGRGRGGPGARSLGGSRRPWGRAPGARAGGGCTSGIPWRRAGGGGRSCRLGEGALRLPGETGWSEVPWAAWEGSTESSAGSPGVSPGGGGGRVSAGTRLLLRQLSRRSGAEGEQGAGSGCAPGASRPRVTQPRPPPGAGASRPRCRFLREPRGAGRGGEGRALRESGARGPAPPCGLGALCRAVGGGARGPSPGRRAGGGPAQEVGER